MPDRFLVGGVFALPARLAAKAAPSLISSDEAAFSRIGAVLAAEVTHLQTRLEATRREPGRSGEQAFERDLEVQRLSSRLRVRQRFGLDVCIGRMVADSGEVTYLGRFGLADADGSRLLLDWRAPAAEPFFAGGHGHALGLTSRRRYRWRSGRIVDYWDEVFALDGIDHGVALDDQSAFIASLGASRSPRMRDVLATIQSDQDAIIRAGSRGALVVDGGPGTGKTVVALHRAAFLLYADPRLQGGRGGLLFVGPHRPYVEYIDDVLPSLGEDGALVATLSDLVAGTEGAEAVTVEHDVAVRRLKSDARCADAVAAAVRLWEHPPRQMTTIDTLWGHVPVSAVEWSEVFAASDGAVAHNDVRVDAWERLLDLLSERIDATLRAARAADDDDERWSEGWGEASREGEYRDAVAAEEQFDAYGLERDDDGPTRGILDESDELRAAFDRLWPLLDPGALVRGLWRSPALLHRCAPWLAEDEVALLASAASSDRETRTDVDLPLLDAARILVGDPGVEVRRRRERAAAAAEQEVMSDVVTHLIAADDSDMHVMSMLRGQDLRRSLTGIGDTAADPYAGPFAHVVVDEAQELTDAEWLMLLRRCPSRSFTIVGDRAQSREGFAESWTERLARVGLTHAQVATLTVNYRTPEEVMDVAGPVIRAVLPDANVPTAIRRSGVPVRHGKRVDLPAVVDSWLAAHAEGTAVVIGDPAFAPRERVRSLNPETVKGLEFDLVVLVDPQRFGDGLTGAVDRYVAMTRATAELVVLED